VVLTNGDNANSGSFALGIADLYVPGIIPVRKAVAVDPKIFDGYVGQYQADSTTVVTVSREGDKLMLQQGPNPANKRELLPETPTVFFMKENTRQTFSFIKDATGQAFMVVKVEAREIGRAKKIQ
jgi:hypothetical protein